MVGNREQDVQEPIYRGWARRLLVAMVDFGITG